MDSRHGKRASRVSSGRRTPIGGSLPGPAPIKRLTLDLHEPLHRAIKKNAAEEGVTMAQKLRSLLSKHYGTPGKRLQRGMLAGTLPSLLALTAGSTVV